MTLTPEQKQAVASWVAGGDNLSAVQRKLIEQFKLSLTYRDVRFLVDDLNLDLKDPAPKVDTSDLSKAQPPPAAPDREPPKKGFIEKAREKLGLASGEQEPTGMSGQDEDSAWDEEAATPGPSSVKVDVDKVSLIPGALASGSVTFSDGVTGKWVVDQYGRPGFTQISKPGYRPSAADSQAFVSELSAQLQRRGY